MYTLEQVIKEFKRHIKLFTKDSIQRNYYEIIVKYLLLESKHPQEVKDAKKVIYHYFQYDLPRYDTDYFAWLYSPQNPVRFAVETFDSIEIIRKELKNEL